MSRNVTRKDINFYWNGQRESQEHLYFSENTVLFRPALAFEQRDLRRVFYRITIKKYS